LEPILNKEINAVLTEVSDLVVQVIDTLKSLKIPQNTKSDIEIALSEALTNIVKHAYNYQKDQKIILYLYKSDKEIIIKLIDFAPKSEINFNKKLEYDPDDSDSLPEGGMGIFLMNKCMTSISLERTDNKNILIMKKKYEK